MQLKIALSHEPAGKFDRHSGIPLQPRFLATQTDDRQALSTLCLLHEPVAESHCRASLQRPSCSECTICRYQQRSTAGSVILPSPEDHADSYTGDTIAGWPKEVEPTFFIRDFRHRLRQPGS